ncbi:hypothetical protein J2S43_007139 [Catenuloplanes nepalensis]|uniref:Uncharacterized protein n=1 Tax=Catenuloplanes nepalensis TaxID=587533 RepID=A0ABT9N4J0_9ACTN|nr:hypothetical protein [Catenuloplanes nepalensis]MDP9798627.1 hypothetical protein [Catenuloplanes nepalensis]
MGLVFGIGRSKTRSQMVREELEEGLDHLRQAATHAAEGVGATVGPRVHAAREVVTPAASRARNAAAGGIAAFTPLAMSAADGARQTGKQTRRMKRKNAKALRRAVGREERGMSRNRKLTGLLMIGVAAGVAGSMIMRKRRQREEDQWTTHESSTARSATDAARQMTENAKHMSETAKDSLQSAQGAVAGRIASATESAKHSVISAAETAKSTATSAMHSGSSDKDSGKDQDKQPTADRIAVSDRLSADPQSPASSPASSIRPAGMAGATGMAGAGNKTHGDPITGPDRWPNG